MSILSENQQGPLVLPKTRKQGLRDIPWFNVTSLLHEGSKGEPETVEYSEIICDGRSVCVVFDVPFKRTESTDQEQDNGYPNVGEDDTHPDLIGQGVHEREDSGTLLCWPLDHDTDSKTHEGLREVYYSFSGRCNGQWSNGQVSLLVACIIKNSFNQLLEICDNSFKRTIRINLNY